MNAPIASSLIMLVSAREFLLFMRVAGVILQPSIGNKDVILERKPSNKDQNTLSNGPPPVIHKQVGFSSEYQG